MTCLFWLLGFLLADLPQVQVDTLKSGTTSGVLRQITSSQMMVGEKNLPLSEVLEVRFSPAAGATVAPIAATPFEVLLSDGTKFGATEIAFSKGELKAISPAFGEVLIKKAALKSLRLQADSVQHQEAWKKLVAKESKKDLVVVRKENKLDFIAGVAGEITETHVHFLVDGEDFPARREAVYGVVYQPTAVPGKLIATAELIGSEVLNLKSVIFKDEKCQVVTLSGLSTTIPLERFKTVDFTGGKVRHLSQMEPLDVQYFPFWGKGDPTTEYRRNFSGPLGILVPITLDGKAYSKGLAIHSKTILKYRLNGEYRRFQTMMGIDDFTGQSGHLGDVHLKISGDGKTLFEGDPKHSDPPVALNLDVSGVRDLTILVDYGGNLDIGDWLDLADAKVSR